MFRQGYIFSKFIISPPPFSRRQFFSEIEIPKPIFFPRCFFWTNFSPNQIFSLNLSFPNPSLFFFPLLCSLFPSIPSFSFFFSFFFLFSSFSFFFFSPFPFPLFSFTPFLQLDISSFFSLAHFPPPGGGLKWKIYTPETKSIILYPIKKFKSLNTSEFQ